MCKHGICFPPAVAESTESSTIFKTALFERWVFSGAFFFSFFQIHLISVPRSVSGIPWWAGERVWCCRRSWRMRVAIGAEDCQTCQNIWSGQHSSRLSVSQKQTGRNKEVLWNWCSPWEVLCASGYLWPKCSDGCWCWWERYFLLYWSKMALAIVFWRENKACVFCYSLLDDYSANASSNLKWNAEVTGFVGVNPQLFN